MNLQSMYDNIQTQIKSKAQEIENKKAEISALEAEIYKLQGATEMLVVVSQQLEKEQAPVEEPKEIPTIDEAAIKKEIKKKK